MPTNTDFEELKANTTSTWETLNGVNGRRFTSKINGNSIFIPATGIWKNSTLSNVGTDSYLWSSSHKFDSSSCYFEVDSGWTHTSYYSRSYGL
jgi:hypothetical protein